MFVDRTPEYIRNLLTLTSDIPFQSCLQLFSNCDQVVQRARCRTGERASYIAASCAWSRLPTELKLSSSNASSIIIVYYAEAAKHKNITQEDSKKIKTLLHCTKYEYSVAHESSPLNRFGLVNLCFREQVIPNWGRIFQYRPDYSGVDMEQLGLGNTRMLLPCWQRSVVLPFTGTKVVFQVDYEPRIENCAIVWYCIGVLYPW